MSDHTTDQRVFNVVPCNSPDLDVNEAMTPCHLKHAELRRWFTCSGCLGDGTRVDLGSGHPVERLPIHAASRLHDDNGPCWVPVSQEEPRD